MGRVGTLAFSVATHSSADEGKPRGFIQKQVRYQTSFFVLAVVVAVLANSLATQGSGQVFGIGALASPIQAEAFGFTHMDGASWLQLGSLLTLGLGLATLALVSASLRGIANWPEFLRRFGLWVIVLSAINALSEELLYRGAIVAVARGLLEPTQIALLSAVLFALAHVRGQASGIAVVAGSAVVGWCLAHAVLQTHGLFWAWCAHFIQDIVIFFAFIAATANPPLNMDAPQSGASVS
jgi:membrane protease YdiL (CAAX protease family)